MNQFIKIRGARQHNLKNINIDIPKNKLVVLTGVSGSGKSSLAFDTLYAEGQRRYVESLSTYARQFLGVMEKPDVDLIEGLSPAISIDQKTTSRNPRSTVGTITEIYDYLRLLFARVGHPHCPICGREIQSQSVDQIVESIVSLVKQSTSQSKIVRYMILSPIVNDKKGEFGGLFDNLRAQGFTQIRVDNHIKYLDEDFVLIKTNKHTIEAVIDKFSLSQKDIKNVIFSENFRSRLTESVEQSLKLSDGLVIATQVLDKTLEIPKFPKNFSDHLFSEKFACPTDNIQIPEIEPRSFSFNSPHGACPKCNGIGKILKVDPGRIFSDELSITEGGILPFKNMFEHDTWYSRLVLEVCDKNNINPKLAVKNISLTQKSVLLNGTGNKEYQVKGSNRFGKETYIYEPFFGIVAELEKRHANTESDWVRGEVERYMRELVCDECGGTRLKKSALAITIAGKSIADITSLSIDNLKDWINNLHKPNGILSDRELEIGKLILNEIITRLNFLCSVGLDYLNLDRPAGTLSGGEAQRIRLASQIGSGLSGVLYVLDEPTIGLHPKDNLKLINTLKQLKGLGNSVVVVEHDAEMMVSSDYIIDFGPGAGKKGGSIIAAGKPIDIKKNPKSITGEYLSGKKRIIGTQKQLFEKNNNEKSLIISGVKQNNLKNLSVKLPLSKLVVITGVSGSGKSSLLVDTVFPAIQARTNSRFNGDMGVFTKIEGIENVNKAILIDQSPIGRTPRSNPATYTKMFDLIRDLYANTKDARVLGFKKGRFSFNVKGGRCEACEGQGQTKIEMQFMSDLWVKCDICEGKRYNNQTLDVTYKNKNIVDVLNLTVDEATEFFHSHPGIVTKLATLKEVGLGYMELGQSATTLSGGEAQRVKLSTELSKKSSGSIVYILDEPTTGLHFADVNKLLKVLQILVERGNSVFVIEHNLDIIKNAEWIIDLGPGGGEKGGEILFEGTLKDAKKSKKSITANYI